MRARGGLVLGFALGVATGVLATWKIFEANYEKKRQEDYVKCRDSFRKATDEMMESHKKFCETELGKYTKESREERNRIVRETILEVGTKHPETFADYAKDLLKSYGNEEPAIPDELLPKPENEPEYSEDEEIFDEDEPVVHRMYEQDEDLESLDPFEIPEEEMNEDEDYDSITYYFYADDVLADIEDDIIDDIDSTVGYQAYQRLLKDKPESMWIKNPYLRTYIEIVKEPRTYEEMLEDQRSRRGY